MAVENMQSHMPHLCVVIDGDSHILSVADVRKIANGQTSVAEMDDPELMARAMAIVAMEAIDSELN